MAKVLTPTQGPEVIVGTNKWSAEDPRTVVVINTPGIPALTPDESRRLGVMLIEAAADAEREPVDDWLQG